MSSAASLKTSTVALIATGVLATSLIGYAIYFDHRRQTDPDFRKRLKRESKKQARAAKEEADAAGAEQRKSIREAVDRVNEQGLPKDPEEVEKYFMEEVAHGEQLCQDGSDSIEAALSFYKALKVYPQPRELITIYDKTVPKPVLDILAEMIAYDPSIPVKGGDFANAGEDSNPSGVDVDE